MKLPPLASHWSHFYNEALVLGLDIGIEGIGVWLRKGTTPIFFRTFRVSLPEAAPLKKRRGKRGARNARQSCRHREAMLQDWIVRHNVLSAEALEAMWKNPNAFSGAFEHRLRAISPGGVASAYCLVACLRHLVAHRGFDYHLTDESVYPWGEELEPGPIIDWARRTVCSPDYRETLLEIVQQNRPDWAYEEKTGEPKEKLKTVEEALAKAVQDYQGDPIATQLAKRKSQTRHLNVRTRVRGHRNSENNFPRELIKQHLAKICENNRRFIPPENFERAMRELLGEADGPLKWKATYPDAAGKTQQSIIDYHCRTKEEAERLWRRKINDCPFAGRLGLPVAKCAEASDEWVRRFKLAMFLAERRIELLEKKGRKVEAQSQVKLPRAVVEALFADLKQDLEATRILLLPKRLRPSGPMPERPQKPGAKIFAKRFSMKLGPVKKDSFNKDFFDQLIDLIHPELIMLSDQ